MNNDKREIIRFLDNITIEIVNDEMYTFNSQDNKVNYNFVYQLKNNDDYIGSKYGILIKKGDEILNSVIILSGGGNIGINDSRYCIHNNNLLIICGNGLFSLLLPDLKLLWIKEIEWSSFEIHKMNDDYIIYGEQSITRINTEGQIIWQNFGSDIFVTPEDFYFEIDENYIYTVSWDGRKYKYDYDGKDLYNK